MTKSYSEKSRFLAVYKTSLKQQLPIGIVSAILFFLIIPLPYMVDMMYGGPLQYVDFSLPIEMTQAVRKHFDAGVYIDPGVAAVVLGLLMLLAFIVALMQTAYMHSKKMTDLYHSMPVRRPALLHANSLASLTVIFVPFAAMTLLTMAAQLVMYGRHLVGYGGYFQYIALDLVGALIAIAGVYAFTVFIATLVGTVFDSFALTCVLGVTPLVMVTITMLLWSNVTYGATMIWLERVAAWLSPFSAPFLRFVYMENVDYSIAHALPYGIPWVLALFAGWLVIAGLLYGAAIVSYNRRKSELSEQTQPQGVLQMIAKCFAAFCGAALFYVIFLELNNAFTVIFTSVFGALLIGLVAELILSRGVRALRRNLAWLAGSGVFFCLVLLGVNSDFIGYENRVPAAESVESVTISYRGRFEQLSFANDELYDYYRNGWQDQSPTLTDPEAVAIVVSMHRAAVDNAPQRSFAGANIDDGFEYGNWISIEYKLKNGGSLVRQYSPVYYEAFRKLAELEANDDFIAKNSALFLIDELHGEGMAVESLDTLTVFDPFGEDGRPFRPSAADAARIIEAVRRDMLAEPLDAITSPPAPALGSLEFSFRLRMGENEYSPECAVILNESYANTLAVLEELGMWSEVTPVVDEVRFYPATQSGFTASQVFALRPGRVEDVESWWVDGGEEPLPTVTDSAEIAAVLSAARNQMVSATEDVFIAAYYQGDFFLGGQLIHHNDLPESVLGEVRERFGISEALFEMERGYPIYPQEVAAVPAKVTVPVPVAETVPAVELSVE